MALYHSAKGSVDYTTVGTPTIVDGVASNFKEGSISTAAAFIKTSSNVNLDQGFDIKVYFTMPSSGRNFALYSRAANNTGGFTLQIPYNNQYRIAFLNSSRTTVYDKTLVPNDGTVTLQYDTSYIFKLKCSGGANSAKTFTLELRNADDTQTLYTYTNTTDAFSFGDCGVSFGVSISDQAYVPFTGSIDLNKTYINVNEQLWFGVCAVEVKKHQIMGPVGYTVVGSPTITDGILSNITDNDYVSVGTYSGSTPETIEMGTSFTIGATLPSTDSVLGRASGGADTGIFFGGGANPGKVYFKHRISYDNGTNWTAIETNTATLSTNTTYYVKFIISLKTNKIIGSFSTDNATWTNYENSFNSGAILENLVNIAVGKIQQHKAFTLPLDLNYTYIKVNGKLWFWQPQETKYIQRNNRLVWANPKLYLTGPVNYTVVGSPIITDGVASGFLAYPNQPYTGYYIRIVDSMDFSGSFEIATRFKIDSNSTGSRGLIGPRGSGFTFSVDKGNNRVYFAFRNSSNTLFYERYDNITGTFQGDKWYTYLATKTNNSFHTVITEEENGTVVFDKTITLTDTIKSGGIALGVVYSDVAYQEFLGSIDLNYTYIKVNDQLWFYGKNKATQNIAPVPANYTYGTTTTSSIGYVDMRTQVFTAVPGAVLGRDE